MKKLRLIAIVILLSPVACAQKAGEWTQQKKTQIKYLLRQIAALQAYALVAEKGYHIARSGLNAIGNIKKGDVSLHTEYLSSLKKVNTNVTAYTKIAGIIAMQVEMVKYCRRQRLNFSKSGEFTDEEIHYATTVFENVMAGSVSLIDELVTLTTGGTFQMNDNERIKNIDKLYDEMQDRSRFAQHFANDYNRVALQRLKEEHDVDVGRLLYGR